MRRIALVGFILCLFSFVFSGPGPKKIRVNEDIDLIQISGNVYMHVSYADLPKYGRVGCNGLVLIQENEAFLFDSPWDNELTQKLTQWLRDSLNVEVIGFVPNHWHVDCMGGLEYLQGQGVESYANQMTLDIARLKGLPVPGHGFGDSLKLSLGNQIIECYYFGASHSMDNIVVWIPKEGVLFPGCMVKSLGSRNLGNTADGDLAAYPETLKKLLERFPDAAIVIPGHGQPGGTDLIRHTLKLASP